YLFEAEHLHEPPAFLHPCIASQPQEHCSSRFFQRALRSCFLLASCCKNFSPYFNFLNPFNTLNAVNDVINAVDRAIRPTMRSALSPTLWITLINDETVVHVSTCFRMR